MLEIEKVVFIEQLEAFPRRIIIYSYHIQFLLLIRTICTHLTMLWAQICIWALKNMYVGSAWNLLIQWIEHCGEKNVLLTFLTEKNSAYTDKSCTQNMYMLIKSLWWQASICQFELSWPNQRKIIHYLTYQHNINIINLSRAPTHPSCVVH